MINQDQSNLATMECNSRVLLKRTDGIPNNLSESNIKIQGSTRKVLRKAQADTTASSAG